MYVQFNSNNPSNPRGKNRINKPISFIQLQNSKNYIILFDYATRRRKLNRQKHF